MSNMFRVCGVVDVVCKALVGFVAIACCRLRDFAFKLQPLKLSGDLINQLRACSCKLKEQAEVLQSLIQKGRNKNKHYASTISEAFHLKFVANECFAFDMHFHSLEYIRMVLLVLLQVESLTKLAKGRIELAKALIRASERKPKASAKAKALPSPPDKGAEAAAA